MRMPLVAGITIFAAVTTLTLTAVRAAPTATELLHDDEFKCQVCHKLCLEYEKKIQEKKGDDPFELALRWARGNTSNYRWDATHRILRPPGQGIGQRVIDTIYEALDSAVLTRYNTHVIMHALHAAAHTLHPPRMNSVFCERVLCTAHLGHCPAHPDKRPFSSMFSAYRHFVEEFDRQHHRPQLDKNRKRIGSRTGLSRSQANTDADAVDPAKAEMEKLLRARHRTVDPDRYTVSPSPRSDEL